MQVELLVQILFTETRKFSGPESLTLMRRRFTKIPCFVILPIGVGRFRILGVGGAGGKV